MNEKVKDFKSTMPTEKKKGIKISFNSSLNGYLTPFNFFVCNP